MQTVSDEDFFPPDVVAPSTQKPNEKPEFWLDTPPSSSDSSDSSTTVEAAMDQKLELVLDGKSIVLTADDLQKLLSSKSAPEQEEVQQQTKRKAAVGEQERSERHELGGSQAKSPPTKRGAGNRRTPESVAAAVSVTSPDPKSHQWCSHPQVGERRLAGKRFVPRTSPIA